MINNDYPRMENGVKARGDGGGDSWALAHRSGVPRNFYMQDVDGVVGSLCFQHHCADSLFCEYTYGRRVGPTETAQDFGVVALFDRKATLALARDAKNTLSRTFYLFQCRVFREYQGIAPRFFYVCGTDGPWTVIELDIDTGAEVGDPVICPVLPADPDPDPNAPKPWQHIWNQLGLSALRRQLEAQRHSSQPQLRMDYSTTVADDYGASDGQQLQLPTTRDVGPPIRLADDDASEDVDPFADD